MAKITLKGISEAVMIVAGVLLGASFVLFLFLFFSIFSTMLFPALVILF